MMNDRLDVTTFCNAFTVRPLQFEDVSSIYALCRSNPFYYRCCPPFVTPDDIRRDMVKLPPNTDAHNKYYLGYFDRNGLVAVLDLIAGYPNATTVFIGFFMLDKCRQGQGLGRALMGELFSALSAQGYAAIRLGWARDNAPAAAFWHGLGFVETSVTYDAGDYTVIVAQRAL